MIKEKELTCIVCPQGCRLIALINNETDEIVVTNHKCKRGPVYAIKELTNPTRFLTATISIDNGTQKRLPVKTSSEIPKEVIFDCMKIINLTKVKAPICMGDVIISNILNTNVDVIATRPMKVEKLKK